MANDELTGEQAYDIIKSRLQGRYEISLKQAGYEGTDQAILDNRIYEDTSIYVTVRGDCPDHYSGLWHELDCPATVVLRFSDHEPGEREPDFNFYFGTKDEDGESYSNKNEMDRALAHIEQIPAFNKALDDKRKMEAEDAA